jgi:hypothetical protein
MLICVGRAKKFLLFSPLTSIFWQGVFHDFTLAVACKPGGSPMNHSDLFCLLLRKEKDALFPVLPLNRHQNYSRLGYLSPCEGETERGRSIGLKEVPG